MKNYKLNNLRKGSILALFVATLMMSSCMGDFDDINSDKDKVPTGDLNKDNLWAAYIQSMQLSVFAEDNNSYQRMDDLCGNIFAGYAGNSSAFTPSVNSTHYAYSAAGPWHDVAFKVVYGTNNDPGAVPPTPGIMNSWNVMRQKVDSSSVVFAVGEIVKVMGMHRVCDMYGSIPYLNYGKTLYPAYDSQADVYHRFFEELDHAISVLSDYYAQNPSAKPIVSFDLIYGSDMLKWIKLANSLKLRLAMRIKYVEPENAQKYAEEAVNHPYGVIEDNGGTAAIRPTSIYKFVNPYLMIWESYGDSRMGANMESFLVGYNDPRISAYFTADTDPKTKGEYHGVRVGSASPANYKGCATPNIGTGVVPNVSDGLYWMHAAEIYFLRAEGAIEGWNMGGSAADIYNKGIEVAMNLWNITGLKVTNYTNDGSSKPAPFIDKSSSSQSINTGDPKLSTITIRWDEGAGKESKLERIITQKWIAMYPNGQEAWSEFRRTGYPKVFPVVSNQSGGKVPSGQFIKRLPFPAAEYETNSTVVNKAVSDFFGGNDSQGTKLWWDVK